MHSLHLRSHHLRFILRGAGALLLATCTLALPALAGAAKQPPPVTVVADAGAGGYEAFPDVARLPDGRVMCVFYAGYDHVSPPTAALPAGGRIASVTSSDDGRTWSPAVVLEDGPADERDPSLVLLSSGRLVLTWFINAPLVQGTYVQTSDDGGATWALPQRFAHRGHAPYLHRTADGLIVLGRRHPRTSMSFSADETASWSRTFRIDGRAPGAYPSMVNLADGSVLVVYYEEGPGSDVFARRFRITPPRTVTWLAP